MTQHECSRVGCTRLTSEQECALHAAEPAGVIHEAKEPRSAPTLERLLDDHEDASMRFWREDGRGCAPLGGPVDPAAYAKAEQTLAEAKARITETFDSLAAERDEWKRRAEALGYQGGR